ncbi:BZ3500_MvSof-1268-A1-R1_Chr4-3g07305 [Microbotryum saponariae]|uniref:BZ3500_MvSof-1268-A1-R1_Chr4-3g07305 protein n=1 Tax=Microbotryum saponariae TaxID=289078 RepID=A0A2X0MTJ1_9BASI|nr:BZ3500_MvSof-1268-A1-R1_Chr4-3g07305 [Microbotryum saponariae]SDA06968.1 BZ3501_MvSof-1269-A2-R1_Chr4-2g07014 [Microbotryum saponariae]
MMLTSASHRRHTFNDLNSPHLQLSSNLVGSTQGVQNSHQWMVRHYPGQQLVIPDSKTCDQGSVLAESMIVPVSRPLSPLLSPTRLDMDKLDKRHRSSLTRLQSLVTLSFEGAELKKQLEERQRVEAKEMAARDLRRRQTLVPTASEPVPKDDEKPRKRVRGVPPPKHQKIRPPFLASLFSCFKSNSTSATREEPQDTPGTTPLDAPRLNTSSSIDEKEPLPNLNYSRASLRPHLASTHSRTDSLEQVVVDWRASRRASSTPAAGVRSPFAPLPNSTIRSNVPGSTTNPPSATKKPSKHSWLDY